MTGLEEEVHNEKRGYWLSATLVNRLIGAILLAIFSIGGYMILWAYQDAAYKAESTEKLKNIEAGLNNHVVNHPDQIGNFSQNIAELKAGQASVVATQQAILRQQDMMQRQQDRLETLIRNGVN